MIVSASTKVKALRSNLEAGGSPVFQGTNRFLRCIKAGVLVTKDIPRRDTILAGSFIFSGETIPMGLISVHRKALIER